MLLSSWRGWVHALPLGRFLNSMGGVSYGVFRGVPVHLYLYTRVRQTEFGTAVSQSILLMLIV